MQKSYLFLICAFALCTACTNSSSSQSETPKSDLATVLESAKECSQEIIDQYEDITLGACGSENFRDCDLTKKVFFAKNPGIICKYQDFKKTVNLYDADLFPSERTKSAPVCESSVTEKYLFALDRCKQSDRNCGPEARAFSKLYGDIECSYVIESQTRYVTGSPKFESAAKNKDLCEKRSVDREILRQKIIYVVNRVSNPYGVGASREEYRELVHRMVEFIKKYDSLICPGLEYNEIFKELNDLINYIGKQFPN